MLLEQRKKKNHFILLLNHYTNYSLPLSTYFTHRLNYLRSKFFLINLFQIFSCKISQKCILWTMPGLEPSATADWFLLR